MSDFMHRILRSARLDPSKEPGEVEQIRELLRLIRMLQTPGELDRLTAEIHENGGRFTRLIAVLDESADDDVTAEDPQSPE